MAHGLVSCQALNWMNDSLRKEVALKLGAQKVFGHERGEKGDCLSTAYQHPSISPIGSKSILHRKPLLRTVREVEMGTPPRYTPSDIPVNQNLNAQLQFVPQI